MSDLSLRKRTSTTKKQYFIVAILMAILTIGMSIGYAYIRKDLNVNGKVSLLNTGEAKDATILGIDGLKAYPDNEPSPYVVSETGIDFSQPSSDTNGRGLYIWHETQKSDHPIYYYRGEVNDNNVVFGGFCWKIVRTTDTGGTKLIYNGIAPSNNTCTIDKGTSTQITASSYNSSEHEYVYNDTYNHNPEASSVIKTKIDDWFNTYLSEYTNYLEDAIWCNDMGISYSSSDSSNQYIKYGAYNRLLDNKMPNPLSCQNKDDSYTVTESTTGNGKLTYPVGTITADETAAGGFVSQSSYQPDDTLFTTTTYLYTGVNYWTMSPMTYSRQYYNGSTTYRYEQFYVCEEGYLKEHSTTSSTNDNFITKIYGVRPMVSLKPGTKPTQGDGTAGNPYIVE